jgi:hypothetical protein
LQSFFESRKWATIFPFIFRVLWVRSSSETSGYRSRNGPRKARKSSRRNPIEVVR